RLREAERGDPVALAGAGGDGGPGVHRGDGPAAGAVPLLAAGPGTRVVRVAAGGRPAAVGELREPAGQAPGRGGEVAALGADGAGGRGLSVSASAQCDIRRS